MPSDRARAVDGFELAVTRVPAAEPAWATMCIAGAMGVRRDYYAPIAEFFAANGIHVLTFDYRGIGGSRPANLRGFHADLRTWAEKDLPAMLVEARKPAPALPLLFFGHSLGGQILGVAPGREAVSAAVTTNAGSGYYRFNERMKTRVRMLWFVFFPLLTPLFGYFPGKRLRMVGDLPRGVADQWRRWCLHPEYHMAEGEAWRRLMAEFEAPILRYSFGDDDMITERATDSLHSFYRAARIERRHVVPAPGSPVGHFGFFNARNRDTLWKEALDWLRAQAQAGANSRRARRHA